MESSVLFSFRAPDNLEEYKNSVQEFIQKFVDKNIVLVTSGGTAVPLESNTVRFIDNFSTGQRGAASVEYFLDMGYAVIFLHRKGSLEPFVRHFKDFNIFDFIIPGDDGPRLKNDKKFERIYEKKLRADKSHSLLSLMFTSVGEYLHYLRLCCQELNLNKTKTIIYLAAAVSDFYIPEDEMPQHKIQSRDGDMALNLHQVPKMLKHLVENWAPKAYTVSFKLETDSDLLLQKSRQALSTYGHELVIGNLLQTRRQKVSFITLSSNDELKLDDEDKKADVELEQKIVFELCKLHEQYISICQEHE